MNIGVDLCHIPRFERLIERQPEFRRRFFTPKEQALFQGASGTQTLAANFAVKEAFGKALGTGVVGFNLNEVEVLRKTSGAPEVILHGAALERLFEQGYKDILCSISHDGEYAIGMVLLV